MDTWAASTFWLLWIMLLQSQHLFKFWLSLLLGIYPEMEFVDHMVILCLTFWGTSTQFSTAALLFYAFTCSAQGFKFLYIEMICFCFCTEDWPQSHSTTELYTHLNPQCPPCFCNLRKVLAKLWRLASNLQSPCLSLLSSTGVCHHTWLRLCFKNKKYESIFCDIISGLVSFHFSVSLAFITKIKTAGFMM